MLLLIFALASPALSWSAGNPCLQGDGRFALPEEKYYRVELVCGNGLPLERDRLFSENGQVSEKLTYENGVPAEARSFSSKGEFTALTRYEHLPNGRIVRTSFLVKNGEVAGVKDKEELSGFDPESSEVQLGAVVRKKWSFLDDGSVDFIANYSAKDPKRIRMKEYVDPAGHPLSLIHFYYQGEEEKPYRFVEKDASGKILTERSLYEPFNPKKALEAAGLSAPEIERRLRHQRNPNRFLLAVIDGGFDYNHPDIAWKWWSNPNDPVDGLDNDGDGWKDFQFGWEREKNLPLPAETSTSMTAFSRPDSHGTHVAHIATRDLEGIALIGFAGDYTRAAYIDQISAFLKKQKVKVVNLSIGLPKDNKDDLGLRDGIRAHERMIRDNPDTLFVVAAGNESKDIDLFANKQYPASIDAPNVMKVGSLDVSRIDRGREGSYQMSPWSNIGLHSVDILAPGKDISAARFGGGYVVHSGTSMASPYMAHEAARLWMKFPALTAAQVRDIFIRSARPVNPRPAIASGGMVDFAAAEKLARETLR